MALLATGARRWHVAACNNDTMGHVTVEHLAKGTSRGVAKASVPTICRSKIGRVHVA